jgi:O-antigen/teichoic acid export membrane protein
MDRFNTKLYTLLRKSERFFKTDMVYLLKGSFWVTSSQLIVSISTFLLAIAFAHFVSKDAYGQYKYVLSIASILGTLTLSGLGTALTRSVVEGYEGTLQHAFWKNIKWSIPFFLISLGASIYYYAHGNSSLGLAMLAIGSLSPVIASSNLYSSYLTAKKDYRRNALYFDLIGNIFPYLCLVATMIISGKPLWLVTTYFVSNAFVGTVLYFRVLKIYQPNDKIDSHFLGYGKHLSLMNVLNVIANNIDQILVFHYIGAAQLAIYNFATALPNQIKGPLKGLDNLMFPKFAAREDGQIREGMRYKFMWFTIFGIIVTTLYIVFTPFIFHIFFPKYNDAIFYSRIFSVSLLGMAFGPAGTYLAAKKKIKEQYIINISSAVLQIILVTIGIIWWGLFGLIIARVLTRLTGGLLTEILYYTSNTTNPEVI